MVRNFMKKVFTTGEVAKVLGININTVIKWFDQGEIEGFKLPVSGERRIPYDSLIEFLKKNDIPLSLLEIKQRKERRNKKRVPADLPINYQIDKENGDANVTDMSESGALVTIPENGDSQICISGFNMQIDFKDKLSDGFSTSARIANLRHTEDGIGLGVQFEDPDEETRKKIKKSLKKLKAKAANL